MLNRWSSPSGVRCEPGRRGTATSQRRVGSIALVDGNGNRRECNGSISDWVRIFFGEIALRRGPHNRLGFAYQVAFVRVLDRFPQQAPLEIDEEILRFAALQLGADAETIHAYARRQQTVSAHRRRIGQYLRLRTFDTAGGEQLARFLEDEALRLDLTGSLLARARGRLRDRNTSSPRPTRRCAARWGGDRRSAPC